MGQDGQIPAADKGKGRAVEPDTHEPSVVDDLIAGWIGGAVGILASQSIVLFKQGLHDETPMCPW